MTKPGGWKHSAETRAKITATNLARWNDPAKRASFGEAMKGRMADPAIRQRIKDGMRRASGKGIELDALRAVWAATCPAVRAKFIFELVSLSPLGPVDRGASDA